MKIFRCDHCGMEGEVNDEGYVPDWESVTVSTNYHYEICDKCSPALFEFFAKTRP